MLLLEWIQSLVSFCFPSSALWHSSIWMHRPQHGTRVFDIIEDFCIGQLKASWSWHRVACIEFMVFFGYQVLRSYILSIILSIATVKHLQCQCNCSAIVIWAALSCDIAVIFFYCAEAMWAPVQPQLVFVHFCCWTRLWNACDCFG
jgi:hypothetical protein